MPKIMHNLIVLMEPPKRADDISLKVGNMALNRCCVDEDAAFESSGVHYLELFDENVNRASKGTGYAYRYVTTFNIVML